MLLQAAGPRMARVNGIVKHNDLPVPAGTVQFVPTADGPMAAGRLNEDGRFELTTKAPGDGARVGEYTVVIVPPSDVNQLELELKPGQPRTTKFKNIPREVRSQSTSPLKAVVEPGTNEFEFDLGKFAGGA